MNDRLTQPQPDRTREATSHPGLDEPLPTPAHPTGASAKGYVAEPGPEPPVPEEGPVPLVPDAAVRGHVKDPDEGRLPPTGRREPDDSSPNDRLMGADR
jgi:hypothetical protein